jgi:hypothetical protein
MSRVAHVAWPAVIAAVTTAACGARTGLLTPGGEASDAGAPAGSDAASCVGKEIPLDVNAPNLYFVLDASGSMQEQSKWTNVQAVVADLITQLGARARVGAAVFPAQTSDACATGVEVMPLRLGDSQGTAAGVFLAATSLTPVGGTPTAATLEALRPTLRSLPQETFAILATDGGPNCDASLSCGVDQCTSNMDNAPGCPIGAAPNCCDPTTGIGGLGCLDGPRAVQAVTDLSAAGIETFVLGIPGSAPYAAVLDQLATAGGTARASEPLYYRVDSADTSALAGALGQIAAQVTASCSFLLLHAPKDPGAVNVYVAGAVVPRDGPDGWTLQGTKLTLEGATCAAIRSGQAISIRVVEGCPTVTH